MKLFTIGDSISQGFMSLAAARSDLAFSTLIARSLGLEPGSDAYPVPSWGAGGLPLNVEVLLRRLEAEVGCDIEGLVEILRSGSAIAGFVDAVEDYYERGEGSLARPQAGATAFFPNVASAGLTVADAWKLTPGLCAGIIARDGGGRTDSPFFGLPSRPTERIAHAVLNPSRNPRFDGTSQLDWLRAHVEREGVENLILWLGSNNILGTIIRMRVHETPESGPSPLTMGYEERSAFNFWRLEHFREEFAELIARVDAILQGNPRPCRVFVATIPPVTIAPLAKGIGGTVRVEDPFGVVTPSAVYFERYTYFPFDDDPDGVPDDLSLSLDDALRIDRTIAAYNRAIRHLVEERNRMDAGHARYVVVDIAEHLLRLAYKRNGGRPTYRLPDGLRRHVDRTGKPVDTRYYHADREGRLTAGGVFSLDGVHPGAIGHGLIAHEFLEVMRANGAEVVRELDWDAIVASDSLWQEPIGLISEIYERDELVELVIRAFGLR
ncbi:hypothetical protein [Marinivivus vitaminiproducens]|uniref:hypothetical protein n=1 Tax=Marinivivus vitaminiproducens TaxID=3035935 RepID=UPI00279C5A72|nr:hypothetical protein P4R82_08960 [Geminicoccaceae bacterium SCSIO 64248]